MRIDGQDTASLAAMSDYPDDTAAIAAALRRVEWPAGVEVLFLGVRDIDVMGNTTPVAQFKVTGAPPRGTGDHDRVAESIDDLLDHADEAVATLVGWNYR